MCQNYGAKIEIISRTWLFSSDSVILVDMLLLMFKKCYMYYSVQNDASLHGHCTNERSVRKRDDKKVRRDVI